MANMVPADQAQKEFEARMQERMRQAMGDLMPDAVLAQLVAKGVEEAFFKDRTIRGSSGWDRDTVEPAWFKTFLKKELEAKVAAAVNAWMKENEAKVAAMLQKAIDDGITTSILRSFDYVFRNVFNGATTTLASIIENARP